MTPNPELFSLLRDAEAVLFDFDGPICDVFAGMPADGVARQLEEILGERVDTDDPLQVLWESVRFGRGIVGAVEDALIAAEMEAVDSSVATPGGLEFLQGCLVNGRLVGIVSNNSAQAVEGYLRRVGAPAAAISHVVGRAYAAPHLMKPNPLPLETALVSMGALSASTVFIGDSLTDIEVARIVGVPVVAYANKPEKWRLFEDMGVFVIRSMAELADGMPLGDGSRSGGAAPAGSGAVVPQGECSHGLDQ